MVLGIDVFENPSGKEYAVPWGNLAKPEESGTIKATDFFFNYYFLPIAFGFDGVYYERTVRAANYSRKAYIGAPAKSVSRKEYKVRVTPTTRGGAYDSGENLYAIDGDDKWNFEITGRVTEFRIWIRNKGRLLQLKRPFAFRTSTGVFSTSLSGGAGN